MNAAARLAWNLRKYRVDRGLSQEALAVDAEIDRTHVSRLERSLENPTLAVLERLAKALRVSICALLEAPPRGAPAPKLLSKGRKPKR